MVWLWSYIIHIRAYFLINVYKFECVYHFICWDQTDSACLHSKVLINCPEVTDMQLFLARLAYLQQIQGEEAQGS